MRTSTWALAVALAAAGCSGAGGNGKDGGAVTDAAEGFDTMLPPGTRVLKVYVAGEASERQVHWSTPPLTATGALTSAGDSDAEYGWMVPMADRFRLLAPDLALRFVGAEPWTDAQGAPYSGRYPSQQPGQTSSLAGLDTAAWTAQRRGELRDKVHCYDLALLARGGAELSSSDDTAVDEALRNAITLLASGSKCQAAPLIYVVFRFPDDRPELGLTPALLAELQAARYVDRMQRSVADLRLAMPNLKLRVINLYTPFVRNQATSAFPQPKWSTAGVPDYAAITRDGDGQLPARLASIYMGDLAAEALELAELRALPMP